MNKFRLISIVFGLCFCTFAFSSNLVKGRWQPDCGNFDPFINIISTKSVNIEINTNSLYISAEIKKNQTGKLEIFLNNVIENTIADISWKDINKSKPIAILDISGETASMEWLGFYDKTKSHYTWGRDSDFSEFSNKNGMIILHRCELID